MNAWKGTRLLACIKREEYDDFRNRVQELDEFMYLIAISGEKGIYVYCCFKKDIILTIQIEETYVVRRNIWKNIKFLMKKGILKETINFHGYDHSSILSVSELKKEENQPQKRRKRKNSASDSLDMNDEEARETLSLKDYSRYLKLKPHCVRTQLQNADENTPIELQITKWEDLKSEIHKRINEGLKTCFCLVGSKEKSRKLMLEVTNRDISDARTMRLAEDKCEYHFMEIPVTPLNKQMREELLIELNAYVKLPQRGFFLICQRPPKDIFHFVFGQEQYFNELFYISMIDDVN